MSYEAVINKYYDRVDKLKVGDPNDSKVNREALYGILEIVPELVRNYQELLWLEKAMDILARSHRGIGDRYDIVALEMSDAAYIIKDSRLNRRYRAMVALALKERLDELRYRDDLAHITNIYLDAPANNILGYAPMKVVQFIDELIKLSAIVGDGYED